ncbi:MAG: hypothetical protein A49_14140 [Methyloceanibacter sp.]|nr:MAG: hypothetical protein A49_14140 [Methyloceanibacter sp.]
MDEAKQWYLVRMKPPVNPNRHTVLAENGAGEIERRFVIEVMLERRGFDVFLPTQKLWRRWSKYTRDKRLVTYPLLPGWIFVGWPECEQRWAQLFDVPLVHAVAAVDGKPFRIPPNVMDRLFDEWGDRQAPDREAFMRTHREFDVGDLARIVEGPFEGHTVRVIDLHGAVAHAVFELLGGERVIEIDTRVLEVA